MPAMATRWQIEATVTQCEVQLRPRRMLKVTVDDGTGHLRADVLQLYPSQQKTMAVGTRCAFVAKSKAASGGGR